MMGSTCIVRTAVVRKPGLGLGLVSFGLRLGLKNLVLFTPSLLISIIITSSPRRLACLSLTVGAT